MRDFPENKGDNRKLKKVQKLVQHFQEQCRHYVPKHNVNYMLNFPENKGDSRKLKKGQKLVQHFQEQCRHYVPKQNITYLKQNLQNVVCKCLSCFYQ